MQQSYKGPIMKHVGPQGAYENIEALREKQIGVP